MFTVFVTCFFLFILIILLILLDICSPKVKHQSSAKKKRIQKSKSLHHICICINSASTLSFGYKHCLFYLLFGHGIHRIRGTSFSPLWFILCFFFKNVGGCDGNSTVLLLDENKCKVLVTISLYIKWTRKIKDERDDCASMTVLLWVFFF